MLTEHSTFPETIDLIIKLLVAITPVVAGLTLLVFFWGLTMFITKAGDEKAISDGKNLMLWGVIGLFVMMSVWGILRFAYSDLGFPSVRSFGIPFLP